MKKIMFYISIILLFFCYDNVLAKEGWATEDSNVYYFGSYAESNMFDNDSLKKVNLKN